MGQVDEERCSWIGDKLTVQAAARRSEKGHKGGVGGGGFLLSSCLVGSSCLLGQRRRTQSIVERARLACGCASGLHNTTPPTCYTHTILLRLGRQPAQPASPASPLTRAVCKSDDCVALELG